MPVPPDVVALLRNVDAFAGATEADLRALAEQFAERAVGAGEWIVRERERAGGIFLLLEGKCEVLSGDRVLGAVAAGDVFGEIAALTGGARLASVRACEAGRLLVMGQEEFQRVLRVSPKLSESVCLSLAKYLG